MNRVIGKYKDQKIEISSLYIRGTYDDYILGRRDDKWLNIELVNVGIERRSRNLFGVRIPYCILDYNNIEYSAFLPPEIVFVHLDCAAPVKKGDGSHLILIWFKQNGYDPFDMVVEKFKSIDWEKESLDFEY